MKSQVDEGLGAPSDAALLAGVSRAAVSNRRKRFKDDFPPVIGGTLHQVAATAYLYINVVVLIASVDVVIDYVAPISYVVGNNDEHFPRLH